MNLLEEWYDKQQQETLKTNAKDIAFKNLTSDDTLLWNIYCYFKQRELRWPTLEQALQWAHTESGEVTEQLLAREPGWVRNNPDDHSEYSNDKLLEEIADQVFMLLIAGMVEGHDILSVMQNKMKRKLEEYEEANI